MSDPLNNMLGQIVADTAAMPPKISLDELRAKAKELSDAEARIAQNKKLIEEDEELITKLSTKILPDIFDKAKVDRIGIPDTEVDVIVTDYVFANIKADWPDEQREESFNYLTELGGEALIKQTISVSFQRGEHQLAKDFVEFIRGWNRLEGRIIENKKGVPWNTLTAFLKEQHALRTGLPAPGQPILEPLKLNLLGAIIGRVCKVVARTKRR